MGSQRKVWLLEKMRKYGIRKEGDDVYVQFWGTGKPRREFLHSDDLADACLYIFENLDFTDLVPTNHSLSRP